MSEKHQYMVDRYSQNLTKYDIMQLFERLRQKKGSITAATNDAAITRKTVHDWESNTEDVKTATKRKILEASLEADLQGTIDYLVEKSVIDYREILRRHINTVLSRIYSLDDPQELERAISSFERNIRSHRGAMLDAKTIPLEEAINLINQKASSLGVQGIPRDIELIDPNIMSQKFIQLLDVFNKKNMFKDEISEKLQLPKEFVNRACDAISYVDPSDQPDEETLRLLRVGIHPRARADHPRLGMEGISGHYISARKE